MSEAQPSTTNNSATVWTVALTAVIALAAIAQIFVYLKQAKIMSAALDVAGEQASTAEKAAIAAQGSTDAMMNGDRAWIAVIPANPSPELHPLWEEGDPLPNDSQFLNPCSHGFPATFKNVGKTPAWVEKVYIQYVLLQHNPDLLSDEPAYIDALKEQSFLLIPNEETVVLTYLSKVAGSLTKGEVKAIQGQRAFLYAYGIVKYKDVYDRPHETRFGYVYHFPQGGLISIEEKGFRRSGPESYNRQT